LREVNLRIPQIDIVRQYKSLKKEIDEAVSEVLSSGHFVMGRWVGEVEETVARLTGAKHGIGVASGTDALDLALMACDVRPGDQVITSPFSFVSVAEVALRMGAKPIFVDIDPKTYNIIPEQVASAIEDSTKAIVPVHLYGQSVDMDPIMAASARRGIPVIEDAAQAIGAKYKGKPVGSIGTMACLSFYPTKNLGCYGDGGMVLTNDDAMAEKVASLRKHGQVEKYKYKYIGLNSRLDSIQAAILLAKAEKIRDWNERRRQVASLYNEMLAGLPVETPHEADYAYHIYHQYTVQVDERDKLQKFLVEKGVGTAVHYPIGLHLQEAYSLLGYREGDFPNCDRASRRVISLPMFPEIEDSEVKYICESIKEFFGNV
jgi:dTDP-4-amino-4,6-dideoxygalactose transaminase